MTGPPYGEMPPPPRRITDNNVAFVTSTEDIYATTEPKSLAEALKSPHWQLAIKEELQAMEDNDVYEWSQLPPGREPISSKLIHFSDKN